MWVCVHDVSVSMCLWVKTQLLTGAVSMRVCADPSPHGSHVCGPSVSVCIDPSPHARHERGPVCTLTIASCSSWARSIVPDPAPHVTHAVRSTMSSVKGMSVNDECWVQVVTMCTGNSTSYISQNSRGTWWSDILLVLIRQNCTVTIQNYSIQMHNQNKMPNYRLNNQSWVDW